MRSASPPAARPSRGPTGRALVAVVALAALLAAVPATAQTRGDEDPFLGVRELTGVLAPGEDLEVRVRVTNPADRSEEGLRVVATLHSAVGSRFAFQAAVDDGRLGAVVEAFSVEIDELDGGRSTDVELSSSAAQLGFRRADQFGVYPLRLQLLQQGEVVDEVRTALVFTSERVDAPIRTALLVPVEATPLLLSDGTYSRKTLIGELGSAGRAQGLVGSLAVREGFAATLAPDALLLDEAVDLAGGFFASDRLGEEQVPQEVAPEDHLATQARRFVERTSEVVARPSVDVLAMPYARADLGALIAGDMGAEAARHVQEAHETLARLTGASPIPGALWPPDALNAAALAVLTDPDNFDDGLDVAAAVETLVLGERHLDIADGRGLTPSPVRELARTRGTSPTVLVPDPWLEDVLARDSAPHGVAVAVQRVLAETATVYFERPFAEDVRGLVLAPPQSWSPERGLAGGLMDALDEAPWIEPVTLSRLARSVEPDTTPVRLHYDAAARARELPSTYVAALADARRSLGSLAGVLAGDDDTPTRFDRLLRSAAAVDFRSPPASREGREMISAVAGTVTGLYSAVTIEDGPQVWMDAEGPVPVTVSNRAEVPLRVRVRLESQRFVFADEPAGQPADDAGGWVVPAGGSRTLTFQATAVTSGGRAPINVVVEDVDGVLVLAQDTLVVRSTAVSVAALVVTGAAGLFLVVWFVQQLARRRRGPEPGGKAAAPTRPTAQAGSPERR